MWGWGGGRVERKKGKEKRVGKKEEIRVPGILNTTKMHRSIYNGKKKKFPSGFDVFLLFLMEHNCSKLTSRGKSISSAFPLCKTWVLTMALIMMLM